MDISRFSSQNKIRQQIYCRNDIPIFQTDQGDSNEKDYHDRCDKIFCWKLENAIWHPGTIVDG